MITVTLFITVFAVCASSLADAKECTGRELNGVCYEVIRAQSTRKDADGVCALTGGTLPTVSTSAIQLTLEVLLQQENTEDAWIGAYEVHHEWQWSSDEGKVSPQGCYQDIPGARDMPYEVPVSRLNPENCMLACRSANFTYAGVQSGQHCFCGNTFGRYGTAMKCDNRCPVASSVNMWCGGSTANFIYNIDGVYGRWGFAQPNNRNGYQRCAALDKSVDLKFVDERCERTLGFICDIPMSYCSAASGYHLVNERCNYVDYAGYTWYEARRRCQQRNGDLIKVESSDVHDDLRNTIDQQVSTQTQFWIGLTRGEWLWPEGESFMYTNWADDEPNNDTRDCQHGVFMSSRVNYKWIDAACNDKHYIVCQRDPSADTTSTTTTSTTTPTPPTTTPTTTTTTTPPTTTTSTTTTTTPPTTTTTTPTTTTTTTPPTTTSTTTTTTPPTTTTTKTTPIPPPTTTTTTPTTTTTTTPTTTTTTAVPAKPTTAKAISPVTGRSTTNDSSGLSGIEIGLLVFVFIILLIIIILIIYLCCCTGRRDSVGPANACLDARPLARKPTNAAGGYDLFSVSQETLKPDGTKWNIAPTQCNHSVHPVGAYPAKADWYNGNYDYGAEEERLTKPRGQQGRWKRRGVDMDFD